jgi:hypothetical protein
MEWMVPLKHTFCSVELYWKKDEKLLHVSSILFFKLIRLMYRVPVY